MLAIYPVGGHVRARLTRPVVRAVAGLLLSSRGGWVAMVLRKGRILCVYYFRHFSSEITCMNQGSRVIP